MPQITSASYNIGNYRQSSRSNSFNRRNSGELANQQNIIAERLRLVNEAKLLKQKQLANRPKLAILFNPTTYPPDALNLMNYIKDDTIGSRFSIINYTDLANTLEEQYNLGFRFFASPTIGSFELYTYCILFCKKYPDALLFTTYSTQYFEDGVLPFNIILSSVNDKDLAHYIVTEILYKVHKLTNESAPLYYKPISYLSLDNTYPIFRKIVYIYTEKDANGNLDTYSEEYGNQLLNAVNLTNGDIEILAFKITDDNFILPEEVKTLLSENPVSGHDFQYNSKTMFILNSYSPEKILQLFDEEYMYDNYFIFGYVFTSLHYTSKYKFNYAICPVGNYSFEGYKTAGFLPGGRQLSPFLYSICDVILKLLPYYTQIYYKYPNFSSTKFNQYFINRMKQINLFVDDNYWYERKIFTYYIGTKDGDLSNAQYNRHIFFKYKFNDGTTGQNIPKTFVYSFVNTNLPAFDISIHLPVINTSNSFSLLNTNVDVDVSGNKTTVTIYFELNNSSEILGNDGLTFNKNQDVINYYKNNSNIEITKFSGIPLSRAGEQFANLPNLLISTTDTPSILPNTSLNKAFYNCSNFNANISSWNVSSVTNMNSMFQNALLFNNNKVQMNWNCNNSLTANDFGTNSNLYLNRDYSINPGYGTRNDGKTIQTPIYELQKFEYTIIYTGSLLDFDLTKIPIINSSNSFIRLSSSFSYTSSGNTTTKTFNINVTTIFYYAEILGQDGLTFNTPTLKNYYTNKTITIKNFGNIPISSINGYKFQDIDGLKITISPDIKNEPYIPSFMLSGTRLYYIEYTNPGTYSIYLPQKYKNLEVYLVGGGGSGGCGCNDDRGKSMCVIGNDSGDRKGRSKISEYGNGAGGGGGEFNYLKIPNTVSEIFGPSRIISSNGTNDTRSYKSGGEVKLIVGAGGASVSGFIPNSNKGKNGNNGEQTKIILYQVNTYIKNMSEDVNNKIIDLDLVNSYAGLRGGGGEELRDGYEGIGGASNTTSTIKNGENSSFMTGGKSGYWLDQLSTYPKFKRNSEYTYGNGGNGSKNTSEFKEVVNTSGPGNNGYARIYYTV
jgi:surface protein